MRSAIYFAGLTALAIVASVGVSAIETNQNTLLDFCPADHVSTDCKTAASMFLSLGKPADDEIVTFVNAIAERARADGVPKPVCLDAADGIGVLGGGIKSEATRGLVETLAKTLCEGRRPVAATGLSGARSIIYGDSDGGYVPPETSSGNSSSGNSSSGNSSSGTSGQTSGTSGNTTSSSSSGGGEETSSSGNSSSGNSSSGNSSSGTSGETSSGASGNTSGTSGNTASGASGVASSSG